MLKACLWVVRVVIFIAEIGVPQFIMCFIYTFCLYDTLVFVHNISTKFASDGKKHFGFQNSNCTTGVLNVFVTEEIELFSFKQNLLSAFIKLKCATE